MVRGGHQPRVLVIGMQSSGSTLTTLLLSQQPDTIGLLDLRSGALMPAADHFPSDRRVVAKATISAHMRIADHQRSFQPDHTVLVTRHPCQIHSSLIRKPYANDGGSLVQKFLLYEDLCASREGFDAVVSYEDIVMSPAVAVLSLLSVQPDLTRDAWKLTRSAKAVRDDARQIPELEKSYPALWDVGNVSSSAVDRRRVFKPVPRESRAFAEANCPALLEWYENYYRRHYPYWRLLAAGSLLSRAGRSLSFRLRSSARQVHGRFAK